MEPILGLSFLASPVILAFLVHIFRDIRGKSRNNRGECYSCGALFSTHGSRVIRHHKGGTYVYCKHCGDRHELWKGVSLCIAAIVGAATLSVVSLSTFEINPSRSFLMAGVAFIIFVLVVFIGVRHVIRKT